MHFSGRKSTTFKDSIIFFFKDSIFKGISQLLTIKESHVTYIMISSEINKA